MNTVIKTIDINAHITNITCEINHDNNNLKAIISFDNLGFGTVTAVKFNAQGYNSFGDVVQIGGKDKFYLIIQDISVEKNTSAKNLQANLPNSDIRKLELEECQICYADGSVSSYSGVDNREFEIEQFENGGNEKETIDAIRDIISPEAKCIPQDTDSGWLCCCERFNMPELNICSNCGASKTEIFKINDNAFIPEILEKHQKNEEERERRAQQEAKAKEKAKRSKDIKISVGFILGIIVTFFIVYTVTISSRTTYSSEEEMKSALQGTYTFYNASGKASRQIVIEGDTATYIYLYSSDEPEIEIRKWDYKHGVIHTFEDLIVTNEGYLKHGNDIYKKGGYMSSSYSSSYDYESAYSVLDITVDRVSNNSSYTVCTGSVKNTGKKTYRYIKVKGSFKDSSGNVLDTDWTYAAGSEGLSPGESTTFRLSVPQNLKITSCSVSLFDYN